MTQLPIEPTKDQPADDLLVGGAPPPRLRHDVRDVVVADRMAVASRADSLCRLAVLASVYVGAAVVATMWGSAIGWIIFWLLGAQVIAACFAAEHEALHGSMFDAPWANHLTGVLLGVACATPYAPYRAFHLRHHSRTHEEGDSEPPLRLRNRLEYLVVVPNIVTGLAVMLWVQLIGALVGRGPAWARPRRGRHLYWWTLAASVVAAALVVVSVVLGGWQVPFMYWVVPLALGLVQAGFLAAPEHYECPYGPAPVLTITRTTISNPITRFFMWNANFHAAHHLVAAVCGRHLPRLHQMIEDDCEIVERSYWSYHRGLWSRIGDGDIPAEAPWAAAVEPADGKDAATDLAARPTTG